MSHCFVIWIQRSFHTIWTNRNIQIDFQILFSNKNWGAKPTLHGCLHLRCSCFRICIFEVQHRWVAIGMLLRIPSKKSCPFQLCCSCQGQNFLERFCVLSFFLWTGKSYGSLYFTTLLLHRTISGSQLQHGKEI